MKLVLIVPAYETAGLRLEPWRYFVSLAHHLRQLGHDVSVVPHATGSRSDDLRLVRDDEGVAIAEGGHARGLRGPALNGWAKRLGADAIIWVIGPHTLAMLPWVPFDRNLVIGALAGPFPATIAAVRTAIDYGGTDVGYVTRVLAGSTSPRGLARKSARRFRRLLFCGRSIAKQAELRGIPYSSGDVLLHPLTPELRDLASRTPPEPIDEAATVAFAGPPRPERGVYELIVGFARIAERVPDARLDLLLRIDSNRDRFHIARVRSALKAWQIEEKTRIVTAFESRQMLHRRLAQAAVVALPYRYVPSAWPSTLYETLALGIPTVTTLATVCADPELSNAVIPAGTESATSLGDAVFRLLVDERLRRRCSELGRQAILSLPSSREAYSAAERAVDAAANLRGSG